MLRRWTSFTSLDFLSWRSVRLLGKGDVVLSFPLPYGIAFAEGVRCSLPDPLPHLPLPLEEIPVGLVPNELWKSFSMTQNKVTPSSKCLYSV